VSSSVCDGQCYVPRAVYAFRWLYLLLLAFIDHLVGVITTSYDPGACDEVVPFHIINGWLNAYWLGMYSPRASENLRAKLPALIDIAGAMPCAFREDAARALFVRSRLHMSPNKR
jgi:hypothetical protein